MKTTRCDALVLGGGKAGKSLAVDLGKRGIKTVLLERSAEMIGGSCINVACIPTKTFVAGARVARTVRRAPDYGIHPGEVAVNWSEAQGRVQKVVAAMRAMNLKNLQTPPALEFVIAAGSFIGPKTVEARDRAGSIRIFEADKIFVNTGTRPAEPAIPGIRNGAVFTSETIQRAPELPRHLVVIGGIYVGLEFAQMFREFGSQVTLLERGGQLLQKEDEDIARALEAILREDGIDIRLNSLIDRIEPDGDGAVVHASAGGETIRIAGSHVLVAAGRTPNTETLNLSAAGVESDQHGFIKVNSRLETSAPGIWALGDVNGGPQFTHASFDDYRIVRTNVFGGGERSASGRLIPFTLFTEPELGRVGLTEKEARASGHDVRVATLPMSVVPRAKTMGETRGLIKVVTDARTRQILGCAILAPNAGEMLGAVQMTMLAGLPYTQLRDAILAHPTLVEGFNLLWPEL